MLTQEEVIRLVEKIGKPGRVRLPGPPISYDEQVSVETIDPMKAMEFLAETWKRYPDGRNFYPTKIEKIKRYAEAMRNGEWEYRPEGDPIAITDGMVTGGRHRLHAILLSHTEQRFNVKRKTTRN